MDFELSSPITTVPIVEGQPRPFEDKLSDDGVIRYRFGVRSAPDRFERDDDCKGPATWRFERRKAARGGPHSKGKFHHGAFDSYILGIRPDLVNEIRKDVLDESDGPMLMHGLQECHNACLAVVPNANRLKPNKEFLEERYEVFRKAG
ncbi:MAG: hypothetical protein LAO21_20885 [Acidobacteriia bacterium]|nr:hypothetical protein [Terriglobia bacterium]